MTTQPLSDDLVTQNKRRAALIERLGVIADLLCGSPLEGEMGDIAYDLLRQAAAQISSDKLRLARLTDRAEHAAEIQRLREVLEPFAVMGRMLIGSPFGEALFPDAKSIGLSGNWSENGQYRTITYGDLRRTALNGKDGDQ
jgi:hypothetical protein